MKFRQLSLMAYGPFSNRTLTLDSSTANLHLIYGPNEAGKSSSLRAITDFLYGIPARTADDFVHPYNKLRIGAVLEHSNGETLHAIRRKANQNSLRCSQDADVVEESQLLQFTGNLTKELFLTLYGLNHERLRLGGESIVRGTGHIGALLFASAAGLSDLRPLQTKLGDETDELMTSTARSGVIVEKIKQWKELQAETKRLQLSVDQWNQVADEVRALEQNKLELEASLVDGNSQLVRLQRITSAIPISVKLIAAQQELEKVSSAPDLPEDFVAQVHELQTNRNLQLLACKQSEDRLLQLDEEIQGISISEEILSAKLTISGLKPKYGIILKSKEDIPKRVVERDTAINKCAEILQRLGYSPDCSDLDHLFLTDSELVRILELGREKSKLDADESNARQNYARIQSELTTLQRSLDTTVFVLDVSPLESEIDSSQRDGDLDTKLATLQTEISKLESDANTQIKQLAPWNGTLEQFEELSIPSQSVIAQFQKRIEELEQKRELIQNQIRQHQESVDEERWALKELERDREILTFEVLYKSRTDRQTLWQYVLDDWKTGDPTQDKDKISWRQQGLFNGDTNALQEAYEESVKRADDIADGMRENADVVAKKVAFQTSVARKQRMIETQMSYLEANRNELESQLDAWQKLWEPVGIDAKTTAEMLDWHKRAEIVRGFANQLRTKRIEAASLRERAQKCVERIRQVLAALNSTREVNTSKTETLHGELPQESLSGILKVAKRKLTELQREQNQRTMQIASQDNLLAELKVAEQSLHSCEKLLNEWGSAWALQMKKLNLDANATPTQAQSVLSNLQQLFVEHIRVKELNHRIETMSMDIKNFESELTQIVNRLAPALAGRSSEEMVSMLDNLRVKNETDQNRLVEKQSEVASKNRSLLRDKEMLSQIDARLSLLCEQAGCTDVSRLLEIGHQTDLKRSWLARVLDYQEQLMQFSGGLDLEEFLDQVRAERERVDQLPSIIQELSSELKRLSDQRDRILGDIRESKAKFAHWNGSGNAAEKHAQCESVAAEIAEHSKRLSVLRLASVLLNTAMESHRKKNQAPVLSRASELFCKLTCGGFVGLQTDFDDQGPLLVAERSTGERLHLAGLSEGTADQLYLSLRIASLEEWLKRHEPVPFIVDDILITFDDKRCAATLEVLSELSNLTQVLFFTHHQHIVDMASSTLDAEVIATHSLAG